MFNLTTPGPSNTSTPLVTIVSSPPGTAAGDSPPGLTSEQSLATLSQEHEKVLAELARYKNELSCVSMKCLELENKLASGQLNILIIYNIDIIYFIFRSGCPIG